MPNRQPPMTSNAAVMRGRSDRFGFLSATLPCLSLASGVLDLVEHRAQIRRAQLLGKAAGERGVRRQHAGLIELPDLPRIGRLQKFGSGAAESRAHVVDVALEHAERIVVAG